MTKYIFLLMVAVGLIFLNSGCTSNKTEDGSEIVENADAEKIEAEDLTVTENTQNTDPALEDSLGETTVTTATSDPAAPTESAASAEPMDTAAAPTLDDSSLSLDTPAPETVTTIETTNPEPTTTAAAPTDPMQAESTSPEVVSPEATSAPAPDVSTTAIAETPIVESTESVPTEVSPSSSTSLYSSTPVSSGKILKKIASTQPYQNKDGSWINTVYVARPKEKLADISYKIYGSDKSKELKKIAENSYLKNRSVKAGDKIYYSSPNRPSDSSKMMIYYEDMGAIPETYVTKKGDRLPKLAKELLGYNDAWKEIWTSNTVESKAKLKEGETLRYWRGEGGSSSGNLAQTNQPEPKAEAPVIAESQPAVGTSPIEEPPQQTNNLPPPPADMPALPSPPSDPSMNAQVPPVDPNAQMPAESLPPPPSEPPPPPPPQPPEVVAETAKPKVDLDKEALGEGEEGEDGGAGGLDSDTMSILGGIGLLVAMLALVIIRKKKQRAQMNENDINI